MGFLPVWEGIQGNPFFRIPGCFGRPAASRDVACGFIPDARRIIADGVVRYRDRRIVKESGHGHHGPAARTRSCGMIGGVGINDESNKMSPAPNGIISPKIRNGVSLIYDGWTEKWSARALLRPVAPRSLLSEIICTLRHPDLTFLLDIAPEEVQYRRSKFTQTENGKFDGFDDFVSYQTQIRSTLLDLTSYYGWTVISASDKKPEVVTEEMISMLIDKGFEI